MASLVAETWAYINGEEDSNGVEIYKFNSALLMSLLEESHGEEYNDEQVNRVIQSLEAEINANMLESGHDVAMKAEINLANGKDDDDQNCLASMEFEGGVMDFVPSSPSDDMNWYIEPCGNGLDTVVEYGDHVSDYSHIYNAISSEEQGFSYLWHDTVAYN